MSAAVNAPLGRMLKIQDVVRETSLHRATIYRRVAAGEFPRPIPIGKQRVAWAERDVEQWKSRQLEAAGS